MHRDILLPAATDADPCGRTSFGLSAVVRGFTSRISGRACRLRDYRAEERREAPRVIRSLDFGMYIARQLECGPEPRGTCMAEEHSRRSLSTDPGPVCRLAKVSQTFYVASIIVVVVSYVRPGKRRTLVDDYTATLVGLFVLENGGLPNWENGRA